MNSKYFLTTSLLFLCALFAPIVSLAQTYAEMDAEAAAADQRLWQSSFLDPIGKRFPAEFDSKKLTGLFIWRGAK